MRSDTLKQPAKKFIKVENIDQLGPGDQIRHVSGNYQVLIVTANYGDRVTAIDTWDVCNASEWEVLREVKTDGK